MKKLFFSVLAIAGFSFGASAQTTATHAVNVTVTPGAIIAAQNGGPASFSVAVPATPGAAPVVSAIANDFSYLNYTVLQNTTAANGKITAKISALIPNIDLTVTPTAAGGSLVGTAPTLGAAIILTAVDQNLLTAIETSWTGTTATDGPKATYTAALNTAGGVTGLNSGMVSAYTITYTIALD